MKTNKAVIGLGFGDEGKGLVTNYLCLQNPNALVVRYSGGQQAGHTVVKDDVRHVFSNFGSGTLNGNPTYWTKYCTVDPIGIFNELQIILKKGGRPILAINGKCPVTTPIEKRLNQRLEGEHGTCGCGVYRTHVREENFFSLLFEDLYCPSILKIKIELLKKEYAGEFTEEEMDVFMYCVDKITHNSHIAKVNCLPLSRELIFEGSQGLLLDQHYGFYPHVTCSNTGTSNILELGYEPECYIITRAYQTRHGNGPMTNSDIPHNIKLNPLETNITNEFQGNFRVSLLDLDLLEYGIMKDGYISKNKIKHTLVITCLDQVTEDHRFTYKGKIVSCTSENDFIKSIADILGFQNVLVSYSDKSENIKMFTL